MPGWKSTEKTRKWQNGMQTIVLMPFPEANSADHLKATRGENLSARSEGLSDMMASMGWGPPKQARDPAKDVWTGGWRAVDKGRVNGTTDVVCADSPGLSAALGRLKGKGDVLYIRGHGGKGSDSLQSSDRSRTIDVSGLVQLLDAKLDKDFEGIIKVYACESALGSTVMAPFGMFTLYEWQPFTQQFADAMHKAGWRGCRYFGYGAKVSTQTWAEKTNARIGDETFQTGSGSKLAIDGDKLMPASLARYEFRPTGAVFTL